MTMEPHIYPTSFMKRNHDLKLSDEQRANVQPASPRKSHHFNRVKFLAQVHPCIATIILQPGSIAMDLSSIASGMQIKTIVYTMEAAMQISGRLPMKRVVSVGAVCAMMLQVLHQVLFQVSFQASHKFPRRFRLLHLAYHPVLVQVSAQVSHLVNRLAYHLA